MGLRSRLSDLLGGGDPADDDPDELIELVTVPSFEAGLIVADLDAHDISSTTTDAFNLVTRSLTDTRIMIRRADGPAAQALLESR